MANNAKNSISERQLQYGSQKEPIQNQKKEEKKFKNFHEDHLYETKGQVLEMKANLFKKHESSESSEESEEQPKKKKHSEFNPAKLNYHEIGYDTYHSHNPKYVVVKNKEANHDCGNKPKRPHHHHHHKHSRSCECAKDLLVEESSLSEQSLSYENGSNQYLQPRSYYST